MRLLHTSDWHIGRSLHGADLLADQQCVLTGLADLIRAESIDVVVVSGDIYDRAIPPAAATAVLDRVLTTLRGAGA
ncbi:MAG: exonuclease subunit SbcD, partial [Actinomycetota bacterium]|nr:exonuclease subunit SbcD [Actinomycetota bacterium]